MDSKPMPQMMMPLYNTASFLVQANMSMDKGVAILKKIINIQRGWGEVMIECILASLCQYGRLLNTYVSKTAKMNMMMKKRALEVRTATWSMVSSVSSLMSTLSAREG